jgi:hypothetical protein
VVSLLLPNDACKRRLCFSALLIVCIVFAGALESSGQDLGALARQEQARKAAQPVHTIHVYTNEDLARPKILVPENRVDLEFVRRKLPPSLTQQLPASEPDTPEVSLGEVARQYRDAKLTRQLQSPQEARLATFTHVYTNDDMTRPKILTPEDDARYLAALKRPVLGETKAPVAPPEASQKSVSIGLLPPDDDYAEAPLGDVARAVYQQVHPAEAVHAAHMAVRFRFPWARRVVAYRIRRAAHSPPQIVGNAETPERRRADSQPYRISETFTVRRGDSLWKLAREHLGRGVRWGELLRANPWIRDPDRLRIGAQIRV